MNANPCDRVLPPKARTKEKSVYTYEETGAMLEALGSEEIHHQLMVLLTLTTGIRNEEMFGLRWSDIDGSTIRIRQCRVYLGKDIGTITKETKNIGSIRDITIDSEIMSLLKKHKSNEAAKKIKLLLQLEQIQDRVITGLNIAAHEELAGEHGKEHVTASADDLLDMIGVVHIRI